MEGVRGEGRGREKEKVLNFSSCLEKTKSVLQWGGRGWILVHWEELVHIQHILLSWFGSKSPFLLKVSSSSSTGFHGFHRIYTGILFAYL